MNHFRSIRHNAIYKITQVQKGRTPNGAFSPLISHIRTAVTYSQPLSQRPIPSPRQKILRRPRRQHLVTIHRNTIIPNHNHSHRRISTIRLELKRQHVRQSIMALSITTPMLLTPTIHILQRRHALGHNINHHILNTRSTVRRLTRNVRTQNNRMIRRITAPLTETLLTTYTHAYKNQLRTTINHQPIMTSPTIRVTRVVSRIQLMSSVRLTITVRIKNIIMNLMMILILLTRRRRIRQKRQQNRRRQRLQSQRQHNLNHSHQQRTNRGSNHPRQNRGRIISVRIRSKPHHT